MGDTGEKDSPLAGSNAVERLRRSISAARAAEAIKAEPEESFASLQNDDDDSSLVLYRDPSRVSMQRSRASVVSGAHEQGDTFFTALKKQHSWQSDADSDLSSPTTFKGAYGLLSCVDSQSNPVQNLSHSAYFSAAGDDGATASLHQYEEGSQQSGLGASLEPSYATSLPEDGVGVGRAGCGTSNAAFSQLQLTSSVLDIINSLYGGQAATNTGQPWHQLSQQDQPLMALAVAAAGDVDGADAEPGPRSSSPGVQQDATNSAEAVLPTTSSAEATSSLLSDASGSQQQPTLLQQQPQPPQEEEVQPGQRDHGELQASDDSTTDSQARMVAMDGMQYDSSGLQQELSCYLQGLNSKADEDGSPLVQLTGDYAVLVERLLREGRAQHYRALQGWEGPHRFEDLPVAQLQTSHSDPQVAAGLLAIAKLDEELREASLKALVSARALNPEQWADAEKRRLERRAAELDAALAKERKRRAHAAKLRGVLTQLDEQCSEASFHSPWRSGASFSYYRLKPQEEDLLAAVLTREEQTLELDNPFDPHRTCLDELPDGAAAPGADQSSPQQPLDMQNAVAPGPAPHPQAVVAAAEQADAGSETDVAAPAGPGQAGTEGAAACSSVASVQSGPISRASSCLSSSVFSMMMRPSSSGLKGQRCSLADIDARLEAIKAEKEGARQLPTAAAGTSRASSAKASQSSSHTLSSQRSTSRPAPSTLSSSAAAGPAPPGSARPSRAASSQSTPATVAWHSSSNSRRASAASSNSLGRSSSTVHTIDFIREQREVKELLIREHELDTQLRALQTSELPTTLTAQQLQTLLQCAY